MTARTLRRGRTIAAVLGVALVAGIAWQLARVPSFATVRARYRPSDAYLLDRHGVVLDTRRVDLGVRRLSWTPLADVSPTLVTALVAAEDHRYWNHHGVDWIGIGGAVRDDLFRHRHRGASTITMQLASLLESPDRPHGTSHTLPEKLRQVVRAYGLEARWTKAEILEAYLNLLQYRGELQGVGAASAVLAGKAPSGLSLAESRVLAALLPNPAASPEHAAARACARLGREATAASCAELKDAARILLGAAKAPIDAERLAPQLAAMLLHVPGERVTVTLDASVQRLVRAALDRQLAGLSDRNVRDGAALVVDNASGEVLAYVGSAGPNSLAAQVDGVRARRQAGSTLKPFLYELAIERGYMTGASLLEDSPMNVDTVSGTYIPQDYDHEYKGLVSARTALASSLNVPAVRTLALVGVEPFRDRLHALGYAGITEDGQYYGYSLALGSAEVSLWEQAAAYRALARGGRYAPLSLRTGETAAADQALLAPTGAFIVSDILSDSAARVVTFGLDSALNTGYWSAVKTGTSKDMRDNWCVGFSSRYTVAVWVGNFEGDPMHDVSGVTGAAPVWREILDALHPDGGSRPPPPPDGIVAQDVRFSAGVESPRREWFLTRTAPGTEVARAEREALGAHFTNPSNGMVIAVDPDIPPARQRLLITVQGGTPDLVVRLNDRVLGRAGTPVLWAPVTGAHHLAIEDRGGRVLDRILFTVR